MPKNESILKQLNQIGIKNISEIYYNLSTAVLYEHSIRRREGSLSHLGPIVVRTGSHTGRSPNDKFITKEPSSEQHVWWGKVNTPIEIAKFEKIYAKMLAYIQGKDLYIQDCYAGADSKI